MSREDNIFKNNKLQDVYNKVSLPFYDKIKHLQKSSKYEGMMDGNQEMDYTNQFKSKLVDIGNAKNIFNQTTSKLNEKNAMVSQDILLYNQYHELVKNKRYETIDDEGNLLFNNNEIEPTKQDGLLKDVKQNKLYQTNILIFGTIIIATLIVGIIKTRR